MSDFNAAVQVTLFFEGGYENNPDDPGGPTNFGITQADITNMGLKFDVRTLTIAEATVVYSQKYWLPYGCRLLENQIIATKCFDMVVNLTGSAVRILQTAVNAFYGYEVIKVDYDLGPVTAACINRIPNDGLGQFILLLKNGQKEFYERVIAARPTSEEFARGWFRRAYWPYMQIGRSWPYLPQGDEGWPPEGA